MKEKTIILEDVIMVKGLPCTAGSKMLENFIAPFDSCAAEKLKNAKYQIETCAPPEFGIISGNGPKGVVDAMLPNRSRYVLSNDFWGNVREQALEYDFAYLYPSYGRVSRYGLVSSLSSMEQIGISAEKPEDTFKLLEIIAGYDERDGMSLPNADYRFADKKKKIKIGKFESSLPLRGTFLILAAAEFANNVSRYDGVDFGYRAKNYKNINHLYVKSRTEGFGFDAKLYAILGNIVLSQEYYQKYYDKAMRVRRLIKNELEKALMECDIAEITVPENDLSKLEYLRLSPLTGCPSLTFVKNGVPTVAFAKHMDENALYAYAAEVNG